MNKKNSWLEIRIKMDPKFLELLSPRLFDLGCEGIHEQKGAIILYFKRNSWNAKKQKQLRTLLKEADPSFDPDLMDEADIPFQNWNEEWKKGFKPFFVTPNLVIQPDWESYKPLKNEHVVTISPKMAFGTGHHESTWLILRLMEEFVKPSQRVLDLGTGSGILAIYAARLGASQVLGVDIDPEAMENFSENIKLNNLSDRIKGITGTLKDVREKDFNLILANINRNELLKLCGQFADYTAQGGLLILSGIILRDRNVIIESYNSAGWQVISDTEENDWCSMVFKRNRFI